MASVELPSDPAVRHNLCELCTSLQILPHKFMPELEKPLPIMEHAFDSVGLSVVELGFLDELYRRRNCCPFCQLVYEATHQDGQGIGHDGLDRHGARVRCWLDWQLDGRHRPLNDVDAHGHSHGSTRRMRLFSKTDSFQTCYIIPLNSSKKTTQGASFQARIIQQEQASITQMRSWLRICEQHHEQCSISASSADQILRLRVVDVSKMCLVEIAATERYCTLSYCWGASQLLRLVTANLNALQCPGALSRAVTSRTVSDAIQLVAALGERYIWIDALGIIQDDREDWARIAPLMDTIYGNCILTICAASGSDSAYGLPGSSPKSRMLNQSIHTCGSLDLVIVKAVEDRIKVSPWNTRAWVFQERMLSKRCLIFVDDRAFFQCRQATWSEELDCETTQPAWTLDMIEAPLTLFNENPLRRYCRSVELYSGRQVTFLLDRLIAWKGIGNTLAQSLHPGNSPTPIHYGLPASHFDWALLWELKQCGERVALDQTHQHEFPSWSWSGWVAATEWKMSTTSGVLLNLHEWLMCHTWIIWYLGSDHGHHFVGPPRNHSSRNQSLGRWAGYTMNQVHNKDGFVDEADIYGRPLMYRDSTVALKPTEPRREARRGCLHFFTWSAYFKLSRKSMSEASFRSALAPGQHRFGIIDSRGDWCGTINLNDVYLDSVGAMFEFIAISDARDFSLEEYDSWNFYVPSLREEAEWYLYFALMIQWNKERTKAERVGLAKIYQQAFHSGSFEPGITWKEITLG